MPPALPPYSHPSHQSHQRLPSSSFSSSTLTLSPPLPPPHDPDSDFDDIAHFLSRSLDTLDLACTTRSFGPDKNLTTTTLYSSTKPHSVPDLRADNRRRGRPLTCIRTKSSSALGDRLTTLSLNPLDSLSPRTPPPAFSDIYSSSRVTFPPTSCPFSSSTSSNSPAYTFALENASCVSSSREQKQLSSNRTETNSLVPFHSLHSPTSDSTPSHTSAASNQEHNNLEKESKDQDPPPPYSEGDSPLLSFIYNMSGANSLITQVQQGSNAGFGQFEGGSSDEQMHLILRGTEFQISREELLTLPEFILLSFFPNYPNDNRQGESGKFVIDYNPHALDLLLSFFRTTAQNIEDSNSHGGPNVNSIPLSPGLAGPTAGIIVLREDLDFYVIPPSQNTSLEEMRRVKFAAAAQLLKENGIFSGLRKSEEPGTTEQHLIEMLTAGGFNKEDVWHHRDREPDKAAVCSLALARLRTGEPDDTKNMAQKLLLFWRKPARRCWWEGVELEGVEGVKGTLKVWTRRVWTLEITVIGLR